MEGPVGTVLGPATLAVPSMPHPQRRGTSATPEWPTAASMSPGTMTPASASNRLRRAAPAHVVLPKRQWPFSELSEAQFRIRDRCGRGDAWPAQGSALARPRSSGWCGWQRCGRIVRATMLAGSGRCRRSGCLALRSGPDRGAVSPGPGGNGLSGAAALPRPRR